MNISGKFILRVAGTLTAISLSVALLLGLTNLLTAERIREINAENTRIALSAVVTSSDCVFNEITDIPEAAIAAASAQKGKLKEAYNVVIGGEEAGYAFKIVAGGSQGDIEMIVGVDADLAVTGVAIVSNSETSGIGSKVMSNEKTANGVGVLDQFIGKFGAGSLAVKTNVDAISGATVSTRGVTKGVNAALAAAEAMA